MDDERFGTRKYSYRHGATTISLRSFGKGLPADTGSGGIQYVVSDVEFVDALAQAAAGADRSAAAAACAASICGRFGSTTRTA